MKKIISLLLVAMMCISLCACGGNSDANGDSTNVNAESDKNDAEEFSIIGKWKDVISGTDYEFKEDNKCIKSGYENTYEINDELNIVEIHDEYEYDIIQEDGVYKLRRSGRTYTLVREEDYERLHSEWVEQWIASMKEGATAVEIGTTYTSANGVDFSIENLVIKKVDNGAGKEVNAICLYLNSEDINLYGGESGDCIIANELCFKPSASEKLQDENGKTFLWGGIMDEKYEIIKAAQNKYVFIPFEFGGTKYYIEVQNVTIE